MHRPCALAHALSYDALSCRGVRDRGDLLNRPHVAGRACSLSGYLGRNPVNFADACGRFPWLSFGDYLCFSNCLAGEGSFDCFNSCLTCAGSRFLDPVTCVSC